MQTGQSADAARVGQGRAGQVQRKDLAPLTVKVVGTRGGDSGSDCPTAPELSVAWGGPLGWEIGCALVSG